MIEKSYNKEFYNFKEINSKENFSNFENIYEKNKEIDKFWTNEEYIKPSKFKEKIPSSGVIFSLDKLPKPKPKIPYEIPVPVKPKMEDVIPKPKPANQQDLDKWAQDAFANASAHWKQPQAGDGFMDSDQYADHPNRMTAEQRRKARLITRLTHGEKLGKGLFNKGFEDEKDVASAINKAISHLPHEVQIREDFQFIRSKLQESVARFIVHKFEGAGVGIGYLHINEIRSQVENAVKQGVVSYLKAFDVDIPLYEKLFNELDQLRENGREPHEVYLGRDGIYAYVARRALDIGQRRAMSWQERKAARQAGQALGRNVKYLVYPRAFRDHVATGAKEQYLRQNGVVRESDPIFYDTGFQGSIPEQILGILGYNHSEMDERMKLLSAPKEKRRVKGIDEAQRNTIVNKIEYNAKPEEVAVGLYKDPVTGKISPVAQPSSPEEQFMFGMVKAAISNYYYNSGKEKAVELAA